MLMPGIKYSSLGAFVLMLAGCTVGPNYRRPAVSLPRSFRGAPS